MEKRGTSPPEEVLELALEYKNRVVGFGLPAETKDGIPLSKWPPRLRREYIKLSRLARDNGLYVTVHAGEVGTASSVVDAIKYLKADRIGHRIKCTKDPEVLETLIRLRKPLEICITSNIKKWSHKRSNRTSSKGAI